MSTNLVDLSFDPDLSAEIPQFEVALVSLGSGSEPLFLKVSVSATTNEYRVRYSPAVAEGIRMTKQLNRSLRLGFRPPVASTY